MGLVVYDIRWDASNLLTHTMQAFVNEYDLGRNRNVAIFFNIGKKYKWWTILLPLRVPPLGKPQLW